MCTAFLDRPNCMPWPIIAAASCPDGPIKNASHIYFVPRNSNKLITRGGTSPDGVETTLIRERKSTHRLGTRLLYNYTSCR